MLTNYIFFKSKIFLYKIIIMNNSLTVITGASSNHYKTLIQFIESFNKINKLRKRNKKNKLIIYNLGLTEEEFEYLKNNFVNHTFETFDYSKYPPYVNIKINFGEFAWKPIIIHEMCEKYGGLIIWMDSGTIINKKFDKFIDILMKNNIYTPKSNGKIKKWVHPKTIKYMNYEYELTPRNRAGGCIGFNYNISWIKEFVNEWKDLALIKECIAPKGSSRKNHRQDQSILTLLYYKYNKKYEFNIIDRYLNFTVQNDIEYFYLFFFMIQIMSLSR